MIRRLVLGLVIMMVSQNVAVYPTVLAADNQYQSPQFHYVVTWTAEWTKTEESSAAGNYDKLALTHGADTILYQGYFSIRDPRSMFDWYISERSVSYSRVEVTQYYQAPPSRLPAILTYDNDNGVRLQEFVYVQQLTPGQSILLTSEIWPASSVPHRIAGVSLDTSAISGAVQASCELVEVRPGYPGFRGNLPGMLGPGDIACLNDLQIRDPYFVRDEQDQQNLAAARQLGVSGPPEEWTWETWMAIAVARKLPQLCYACVATNAGNPLPSLPSGTDMNDPRIRLGRFGERTVAARFLDAHGIGRSMISNAPTDDQLRAIIGMANPGVYLTAPQLISAYDEFLSMWYCLSGPPCSYPDVHLLYANLREQGGYAPISGNASEGDQYYVLVEGVSALSLFLAPPGGATLVTSITSAFDDWRMAGPQRPSFADWYRENYPAWL